MGDIISFSKGKKNKNRQIKEDRAKENRVLFGRRKTDKKLLETRKAKRDKNLSDHKKED